MVPAQVTGGLRLLPEYAGAAVNLRVPRYLVVFDASGSMSANFDGQCNETGTIVQCSNGPPGYPDVQVINTGTIHYWRTQQERRIYVAKQALIRLARLANMPGNASYDSTRPADQMAVVWFNEGAPTSNVLSFSSNPASITNFIIRANNINGSYRSEGGTNGAAGLYRAQLLLSAASPTVDINGQTYTYENHVIFITDGISSGFFDPTRADLWGGQSLANTYPANSYCNRLGALVVESAVCQTTDGGGMFNGWDRPITQMINVSQTYLTSGMYGPTDVYVVAISHVATTGLSDGVPTNSTDYFFPAPSLETYADGTNNVDAIIDTIYSRTLPNATICQPMTAGDWASSIDAAHLPDGASPLGEVALTSVSTGVSYTAPITRDPTTGELSYLFTGLSAGSYQIQASLFYKGDDGVTRIYSKLDVAGTLLDTLDVTLSGQTQTLDMLSLRLGGDVCATPQK